MRGNIRECVRIVAETLDCPAPIVEIGALQVAGQPYSADLRPLFVGKEYLGCDVRPGRGVDRIEDVHQLSFASESVGTVLMLETLEHVKNPLLAMAEICRALQPGGVVVISSCMDFPVHEYPADYWRFTPQAFDLLLEGWALRRVYVQGLPRFPHSLVGVGLKASSHGTLTARNAEALRRLDGLVGSIAGRLTQEISPRLGPDPFRLLGEELREEERRFYPEEMLHVAYDRLLQKDEQVARLQCEIERLKRQLEAIAPGVEANRPVAAEQQPGTGRILDLSADLSRR